MITASELRIGNWVEYNPKAVDKGTEIVPLQIISIDKENGFIVDDGFDNVYAASELNPIYLTPEILEKCGFEINFTDDGGRFYSFNLNNETYCDLSFIEGDKNGFPEVCLFPYEEWFRYKYLHQLQNLYFSLTGKELCATL